MNFTRRLRVGRGVRSRIYAPPEHGAPRVLYLLNVRDLGYLAECDSACRRRGLYSSRRQGTSITSTLEGVANLSQWNFARLKMIDDPSPHFARENHTFLDVLGPPLMVLHTSLEAEVINRRKWCDIEYDTGFIEREIGGFLGGKLMKEIGDCSLVFVFRLFRNYTYMYVVV